ncbi:related to glutathione S-transferase III [Rhynchosporium secalis]|uniref:Related to glutathione S-transferase III n=1 Tax=Rhynchosporium secalis TaxID=38038 RepID=A0A1E1MWK6_RHYSE|nr:related to glutathione S-transferase III [Rhynchosporium secalis]
MADNTPTLHHLDNSQSLRILWLLEELSIPYNLEIHTRNPPNHPTAPFRSPPSMTSIGHGKAPTLVTGPADGSRIICESSAIATYLIRTFDTDDKFGLKNGDWVRDETLCSLANTSLSRATSTLLLLDFGMLRNGTGPGGKNFDGPEIHNVLTALTRELKEGPKGGFFMGERPGRADVMLEFGLTSIKQRQSADLEKDFPELDAWLKRVYEREAWKRAVGKAYGGTYDLTVFPTGPHL